MFKVSGWALPTAKPAVQVDTAAKKKTKRGKTKKDFASGSNSVEVTAEVAAKIKERERASRVAAEREEQEAKKEIARNGGGDTTTVVNEDNVDKLWHKVIEGAGAEAGPKKRKRGSAGGKNRKLAPGEVRPEKVAAEEKEEVEEAEDNGEPKRKKTLKEKRREKKAALDGTAVPETAIAAPAAAPKPVVVSTLTPLQLKMRAKLTSARFRHINETLYTTPSVNSLELFHEQPDMYTEYHLGFRQQVAVWPSNPVDRFIADLRSRSNIKFSKGYSKAVNSTSVLPLPRDRDSGICTVADLGCGDAKIAATFNHGKGLKEKIKVLSYDLQASTPQVTVADIANLPLEAESVDITIFCLALMGTNFLDFVDEAYRILRWRGELWIAEIKSRFHRKGEAKGEVTEETEQELVDGETKLIREAAVYKSFVDALEKRGFTLRGKVDAANRMFVRMEFVKMPEREKRMEEDDEEDEDKKRKLKKQRQEKGKSKFIDGKEFKEAQLLKPCVYKLR